ncbi:MAG: hypothetical protein HC818_06355 [Synechococcaceae cyanobacterium RM1_1_27]|nr:hypothetical protein [Synechococcaceae cyanobacterium SM2_3_2]NJO86202.1 hypothetical protein [Synechococcaceae cyanobacterium RM1_1_27]
MNHQPSEDPQLQAFLQSYANKTPDPSPDLETRILAALTVDSVTAQQMARPHQPLQPRQWRWIPSLVAVLVAGFGISGVVQRVWQPTLTVAEMEELELFMAETWGVVTDREDESWLSFL